MSVNTKPNSDKNSEDDVNVFAAFHKWRRQSVNLDRVEAIRTANQEEKIEECLTPLSIVLETSAKDSAETDKSVKYTPQSILREQLQATAGRKYYKKSYLKQFSPQLSSTPIQSEAKVTSPTSEGDFHLMGRKYLKKCVQKNDENLKASTETDRTLTNQIEADDLGIIESPVEDTIVPNTLDVLETQEHEVADTQVDEATNSVHSKITTPSECVSSKYPIAKKISNIRRRSLIPVLKSRIIASTVQPFFHTNQMVTSTPIAKPRNTETAVVEKIVVVEEAAVVQETTSSVQNVVADSSPTQHTNDADDMNESDVQLQSADGITQTDSLPNQNIETTTNEVDFDDGHEETSDRTEAMSTHSIQSSTGDNRMSPKSADKKTSNSKKIAKPKATPRNSSSKEKKIPQENGKTDGTRSRRDSTSSVQNVKANRMKSPTQQSNDVGDMNESDLQLQLPDGITQTDSLPNQNIETTTNEVDFDDDYEETSDPTQALPIHSTQSSTADSRKGAKSTDKKASNSKKIAKPKAMPRNSSSKQKKKPQEKGKINGTRSRRGSSEAETNRMTRSKSSSRSKTSKSETTESNGSRRSKRDRSMCTADFKARINILNATLPFKPKKRSLSAAKNEQKSEPPAKKPRDSAPMVKKSSKSESKVKKPRAKR